MKAKENSNLPQTVILGEKDWFFLRQMVITHFWYDKLDDIPLGDENVRDVYKRILIALGLDKEALKYIVDNKDKK